MTDNLFISLLKQELEKSNSKATFFVLKYINDLIKNDKIELIDTILDIVDPSEFIPEISISLLTITGNLKDKLKNRQSFYLKTENYFDSNFHQGKNGLLSGLK